LSDVHRDLSCPQLWAESLERSRSRRAHAAQACELTLPSLAEPSRRSASLAAALAVAGGASAVTGGLPGSAEDAAASAKVRHRGSGVTALQRKLGIPADGVFGPRTERALRRWQRRHGLAGDGVAGPVTRGRWGSRGARC